MYVKARERLLLPRKQLMSEEGYRLLIQFIQNLRNRAGKDLPPASEADLKDLPLVRTCCMVLLVVEDMASTWYEGLGDPTEKLMRVLRQIENGEDKQLPTSVAVEHLFLNVVVFKSGKGLRVSMAEDEQDWRLGLSAAAITMCAAAALLGHVVNPR